MKNDKYLKVVLTIIAFCLVVIVLQNSQIIPKAQASGVQYEYMAMPINEDGSIDVNVVSTDQTMNVNILEVGGDIVRKAIPIKADKGTLDVNIYEVGGWSVSSGVLPVENKY